MQRSREAARGDAVEYYYFLVNSEQQTMHIRSDPYLTIEAPDLWVEIGWVQSPEDEAAHLAHIEQINIERAGRGLDPVIVADMR